MYRGTNHVNIGQELVGELINFTVATTQTPDYDDDEPVPTTNNLSLMCQIKDLSKQEREIFETKYDTNKMISIHTKKGSTINQDDYFIYNNLSYTVVQTKYILNKYVIFALQEERMS